MYRTDSEILIDAPPQVVWEVVCDLDRYPEWNRFTPRITLASRELKVGAELDLDCQMTDRNLLRDEHEVILAVEPDRRAFCMGTSRTRGRPGIKSFRWQICEDAGQGRTHLVNFEQFHGPLAPIVHFLYAKKLKAAFERYCQDLKARVESRQASSAKQAVSSSR
ncbi:MAG TPA: SRPBCC domain-containing protein [Myxococcales bacterium]|jgi:uncharacterized protein YndB with AHSA1/START domain